MNLKNIFKSFFSWQMILANILGIALIVVAWNVVFLWIEDYTYHGESVEMPDLKGMNLENAIAKIEENKLNYIVDSARFDEKKPAFTILSIYPMAGKRVKEGRKVYVKVNPKNRLPVTVPDVIDKSLRIAILQLESAGLRVRDTIYAPDIAKDAVLRLLYKNRDVEAGFLLPRNSYVDVVAGSGNQNSEELAPNIIGYTLEKALLDAKRNQLEILQPNYIGFITDSATAKVFYQFPRPDKPIGENRQIEVYLSNQSRASLANYVNLLNKKYSSLEKLMGSDSLNIDTDVEVEVKKGDFEEIPIDNYNKIELEKAKTSKEDSLLKEFLKKNN